jgi:glyoxylase-like metal-dependent hydrolase (beta-lactamase superfamily II)
MRIVKIGAVVLVVLLVVAALAWRHLNAREMPPEMSRYLLDVRELRRLAGGLPGDPPVRVHSERVAEATLPLGAVFAGRGFAPHPMVHQSFQILYPDGHFLVLDSGFDRAMHAEMDGDLPYHEQGWQNVQAALARADAIYVTHEHGDHLQGIAAHRPPEELVGRLHLTAEQLANTGRLDAVDLPAVLRETEPLAYEEYRAVAPGAVLVKAPGHTPGSQMLYVRLADGRELLFIGDVAWHMDAIRELHYRPRLVTDYFLNEDREAVLNQFRRLHDLDRMHPEVRIVVSHDREQRAALLGEGLLVDGFDLSAPAAPAADPVDPVDPAETAVGG